MSKQNVIICDICGKTVAQYKCRYCGKDLCDSHTTNLSAEFIIDNYDKKTPNSIKIGYQYRDSSDKENQLCGECVDKVRNVFDVLNKAIQKDKSYSTVIVDKIIPILRQLAKVEVI